MTDLSLFGRKGFVSTAWLLGTLLMHALKQASVESPVVKEFILGIYTRKVRIKLMRVPKDPRQLRAKRQSKQAFKMS